MVVNSPMKKAAVLIRSPIEFVVAGPAGGRDRVLVRSRNAGLDLIGLVARGAELYRFPKRTYRRSSSDILSLIFGGSRPLNVVSSFSSPDVSPEFDSRHSVFSFAWNGYASVRGTETVAEMLNLQLPDLYRAISEGDVREIEWALGPIIQRCAEINENRLRIRRVLVASGSLYITVGIFALIFLTVFKFVLH